MNNDHPALMTSYTFSYMQEGKFIYIHIVPLIDIWRTHAPCRQLNKILQKNTFHFTVSCMNCQTTSDRPFEEQPHMPPPGATMHAPRATTHTPPGATMPPPPEQPHMPPLDQPCTPPLWTECGHTLLKILPCPNFVAGGNKGHGDTNASALIHHLHWEHQRP